ncbi:MAG: hypothetical protein Sylvanvirus39_4, partial [Sylvanvirus sp.]
KLEKAEFQVEEIKMIMQNNVKTAIANGEQIDDLEDKSIMIGGLSHIFERESSKLKWKMCRQHWKSILLILLIILLVIVITILIGKSQ